MYGQPIDSREIGSRRTAITVLRRHLLLWNSKGVQEEDGKK
jgi:hypothetical protein